MELEDIRQLLEGEGFVATLEKASPDMPLDQLVVVLDRDNGRRLALQIAFLPDPDAEIEHARLLQLFAGLDDVAPSEAQRRRLDEINRTIPIGSFHVHDQLAAIYFRHVCVLPRGNVPAMAPVLVETVSLVEYILDSLVDRVLGDDVS